MCTDTDSIELLQIRRKSLWRVLRQIEILDQLRALEAFARYRSGQSAGEEYERAWLGHGWGRWRTGQFEPNHGRAAE